MQNIVSKGWGYELWVENNELYCGKHLHVLPSKWCSVHYHKNKKETFYVINGELKLEFSTKELAIEYAKKNNINFEIIEPNKRKITLKSYADNFTK